MTPILTKEVFSAIAMVLTFIAFYPYIRAIMKGRTRPHVFSWFIWAAVTFTVATAQLAGGAGVGAWPIAVSGLITGGVALLALSKSADTSIHRMDWVFLALAFSALPLWWLTADPLAAVIILTSVDLLGFGPSIRKAWTLPHEENALFFTLGALRNGLVILALEHSSWTTALFPAAVGIACLMFVTVILARRQIPLHRNAG
ncbi:hypothetical protein [Henriciella sp.]|uniref:hypothetical protein n=1 Tax=Henriciella sp. TaxID=1968823 RepID=UPI0026363F0B|nr:hypothetical protein [Henriciella sp.]